MKLVIDLDEKDYKFIKSARRIMKNSDTFQRIAADLFKAVQEAEVGEVVDMNNDRPIIFTISYSTSTKSYTIATTDARVVCIDKVTDNLLSAAEITETMCNITGILNNRGYAVLFEERLI